MTKRESTQFQLPGHLINLLKTQEANIRFLGRNPHLQDVFSLHPYGLCLCKSANLTEENTEWLNSVITECNEPKLQ